MKGVLSIFASVFLLIVLSYLFVYVRMRIQMPDTKAIGFPLVRDWTIYSPLYWIFVVADRDDVLALSSVGSPTSRIGNGRLSGRGRSILGVNVQKQPALYTPATNLPFFPHDDTAMVCDTFTY